MNALQILKDQSGFPTYAPNLSADIYACSLAADTATSLAVPSGARIAVFGFSSGNDYWIGTATFSIPAGNSFSALNVYLNPPPLSVIGVSALWFRSSISCKISVAFYG